MTKSGPHACSYIINGRSQLTLIRYENSGRIIEFRSSLHAQEREFYSFYLLLKVHAFDNNGSCELILFFHIVRPCLVASLF